MKYTNIKSKFIKDKIENSKWEDKNYVDSLIFLENYILGKINLSGGGSRIYYTYQEEYKKILKELKPEEFAKLHKEEIKKVVQEKQEEAEHKKRKQEEEQRDKKDWIKAGGKL
jgi:hypothetical protein